MVVRLDYPKTTRTFRGGRYRPARGGASYARVASLLSNPTPSAGANGTTGTDLGSGTTLACGLQGKVGQAGGHCLPAAPPQSSVACGRPSKASMTSEIE